ncbi:MAG: transposase [Planctomycetes bacterium]|nr:transposase [Planctomycetota bacterium]
MARQPRIEYESAFYHVTSRGNLRDKIFYADADRTKLIEILKRTKERYGYIIHAFVLMDNHYHFLIETPQANLNQLMQNINTSYTVFINKKYHRSGHLFQGRYKAIVVDKDNYLLTLSRYIHLNPVKAKVVRKPEEYKWSSYKEYIGLSKTGLVDTVDTLSYFSKYAKTSMKKYKEYVETEITEKSPFDDVKGGIVLGKERFMEKIKKFIEGKKADKELHALKRIYEERPIQDVIRKMAEYYQLSPEDLIKKTRRYSRERKVTIYLSKIHNKGRNKVVGEYFGISPQQVTNILTHIENELESSKELRIEIENISCIL